MTQAPVTALDIVPIVISILAFGVSVFSLWYTRKGFRAANEPFVLVDFFLESFMPEQGSKPFTRPAVTLENLSTSISVGNLEISILVVEHQRRRLRMPKQVTYYSGTLTEVPTSHSAAERIMLRGPKTTLTPREVHSESIRGSHYGDLHDLIEAEFPGLLQVGSDSEGYVELQILRPVEFMVTLVVTYVVGSGLGLRKKQESFVMKPVCGPVHESGAMRLVQWATEHQ